MHDSVTFRSTVPVDLDRFPPGEELANCIAEKLTCAGLVTKVVDNYEDFAWWIESQADQRMPWVLLGYIGDGPSEWLVTINSSVSWLGRLFGRSDSAGRRLFADSLHALLTGDPHFTEVRWHSGDYQETGWASSPE